MPNTTPLIYDLPPDAEIDRHIARARALRSQAAFALFTGLASRLAQAFEATLGRVIHGIRHRETTRWPAVQLRHGRT